MLSFPKPPAYQASNCFFTYGTMGHLDPAELPSKGKPWSALLGQDFVHKVALIIPQDLYELVRERVLDARPAPEYKRVIMTLGEILQGDFLKEYIKIGNIAMLSEGRIDVESVFTIRAGILTMYLDKETYERAGLTGRPYGVKGKRGLKPRWVVEYDLQSPSMFPGKKGFDRVVYACKNVLNTPVTWLFCNVKDTTPEPDPLAAHFPASFTCNPEITQNISVSLPPLNPGTDLVAEGNRDDFEEFASDTHEWLSLLRLQSPRVETGDVIDPYLSRYQTPGDPDRSEQGKVCKISWQGFFSPIWVRQTLADVLVSTPSRSWFSLSSTTFSQTMVGDNKDCTVLRPPDSPEQFVLWDVKSHE